MNEQATNRIIASYDRRLITSATAMVLMFDTNRAAELASSRGIAVGLHLNFTAPFTSQSTNSRLYDHHRKLIRVYQRYRYSRYLYHFGINKSLDYCFKSQYEEFLRVFKRQPTHIDGHHFAHLSLNLLTGKILPSGVKIRKILDEPDHPTNLFDSIFRHTLNRYLKSKFVTTDFAYSIAPLNDACLFKKISKAKRHNVEVMTHPEKTNEFSYMRTDRYFEMVNSVSKGSYRDLRAACKAH
jgi:predicted glycoside hydrolase/deacetylase ChbG (UPF0249 family)